VCRPSSLAPTYRLVSVVEDKMVGPGICDIQSQTQDMIQNTELFNYYTNLQNDNPIPDVKVIFKVGYTKGWSWNGNKFSSPVSNDDYLALQAVSIVHTGHVGRVCRVSLHPSCFHKRTSQYYIELILFGKINDM